MHAPRLLLPTATFLLLALASGCNDAIAWADHGNDGGDAGESGSGFDPELGDDDGGGEVPGEDDPGLGGDGDGDGDGDALDPGDPNANPGVDATPPHCGDGVLAELEQCDDGNLDESDGCLSTCVAPASCLMIHQEIEDAPDGHYMVAPLGIEPFEVWCDMTTDGGGYSFLKLEADEAMGAPQAEQACEAFGMHLLIPRTQAHLYSSFAVAMDPEVGTSFGPDYLRMLGVYAAYPGASCSHTGLNHQSAACHWQARDLGPFWVGDRTDIAAPTGTGDVATSLAYDIEGGMADYAELAAGAHSSVFTCDFGDKQ